MSSTRLIRWSGPFTILAGLLLTLFPLIHPNHDPDGFQSWVWVPAHLTLHVAAILLLFGLTALYARQIERSGWLGIIGYVVAFVGTASFLMGAMIELFIIPFMSLQDPAGAEGPPPPGIGEAFLVIQVLMAVGYVLFGVATMRAGVWPRGAALLLAIGMPLTTFGWQLVMAATGMESDALTVIGDVLLAVGLVWLGSALWTSGAERRITTATVGAPMPAPTA